MVRVKKLFASHRSSTRKVKTPSGYKAVRVKPYTAKINRKPRKKK